VTGSEHCRRVEAKPDQLGNMRMTPLQIEIAKIRATRALARHVAHRVAVSSSAKTIVKTAARSRRGPARYTRLP